MNTHIAMLRGINVSGQKLIKMADLRLHMEELRFSNVQTYIQSGNIIFKDKQSDPKVLEAAIHKKILKEYGFEVPVIVKQAQDLISALENNPFLKDKNKDPNRLYFTFLDEIPSPDNVEKLENVDYRPEEFTVNGTMVYGYSPLGLGNAKVNNNFIENKLKVAATTRNLRTVNKLIELAKMA
ncbi:DUF1697 domain-containing protein [bacterium AH-315-C07]|nr:DUF1697 domain-containing protein [bacterium AH-315-C07]